MKKISSNAPYQVEHYLVDYSKFLDQGAIILSGMERITDLGPEIASLHENFARLESTEGFALLTSVQRRMIKASLYFQARTERATPPDKDFKLRYSNSFRVVKDLNCHSSLISLAARRIFFLDPEEIPLFSNARYLHLLSAEEAETAVNKFGFPCVVHIKRCDEEGDDLLHSFLALGYYNDDVVTWDKKGFSLPFRVTNLKEEYSAYKDEDGRLIFWGLARLGEV